MKQNKLKRIILKHSLSLIPTYKHVGIHVGNYIRLNFFNDGWYNNTFYGVCTKSYHTKNYHSKICLYNSKQRLNLIVNLNLNIFKSVIKFL
jgi:hypothetical protein